MQCKILLLSVALLIASCAAAEDAISWGADFDEGQRVARESGKLLLVHFATSWCGFCKKMENETYRDPQVAKALNEGFVCVRLDAEAVGDLRARLRVGKCDVAFLDGEGDLVFLATGFRPPARFLELLGQLSEEMKAFQELKESLAKSPDDPKLNYRHALELFKRGRIEDGLAALDRVAACDPGDQAGLADDVDLARVEQMLVEQAFADAEAALRRFLENRETSELLPKAYLFLGLAYVGQNRFDEGIATWRTGIERFPNAAESKYAQSMIPRAETQKEALQKKQSGGK